MAMVWLNNLGFANPYGTTSREVDALFTGGARDLENGLRILRVGDGNDKLLSAVIECLVSSIHLHFPPLRFYHAPHITSTHHAVTLTCQQNLT